MTEKIELHGHELEFQKFIFSSMKILLKMMK